LRFGSLKVGVVTGEAASETELGSLARDACGWAGILAEDAAPLAKAPEGLDLRVAHDNEPSAELLCVNEAAYGMGMQAAREHFGSYAFWKDHFAVVGRVGGKPVSSSSFFVARAH
jgi:hypothetical protein